MRSFSERLDIEKSVKQNNKTFAKNTFNLSVITSISRVTGFLRVLALGSVLGLTQIANSFNLANTIPNMIYELILGGILTSIIIPIFVEHLVKEGDEGMWKVASILINGALIILGLISIGGIFFSYYFVRIQTLTVKPEDIALATFFFRFFAIQILFYGLGAITTAILNSYRRFSSPAIAPIFNNSIVILTVIFLYAPLSKSNPRLALSMLAIGTTAGVLSMLLVQLPALMKVGIHYRFSLNFRHPAITKLIKLSLPLLLYVATNQLQLTVENNLAFPRAGGVSAIVFTLPFFQLPFGIFAVSIITALFPGLSENAALKNMQAFKKSLSLGIRTTAVIIIPSTVIMVILARPILNLAWAIAVLVTKRITLGDISIFSSVLVWLSIGLLSYSIFMFLLKTFYSLQDTVTPAIVNIFGVGLLIITDILLIERLGVAAIAAGRTVSFSVMFIVFLFLLRKKIGGFNGKKILFSVSKSLLSGFVMSLAVFFSLHWVNLNISPSLANKITAVFLPALIGLVIFLLFSYLLKNEELSAIARLIRKK